jgi:uncharacterized membrane protein
MCSRLFVNKIAKTYRKVEKMWSKIHIFSYYHNNGFKRRVLQSKGCSIRPFKIILADIFLEVPFINKGTAFMAYRLE